MSTEPPKPKPSRRKKKTTSIYLEPSQLEQLHVLSTETKIPAAVLIREGIDMMLKERGG